MKNPKSPKSEKPKLLFLCTGNSCRSQMAEGFGKKLMGDRWDIYSAGVAPSFVHPLAVSVMNEAGVDISRHYSKGLDEIPFSELTQIITLCGHADETCPAIPSHAVKEHWPIEDPFRTQGREEVVWKKFREVRDEIRNRIEEFSRREAPGALSRRASQ